MLRRPYLSLWVRRRLHCERSGVSSFSTLTGRGNGDGLEHGCSDALTISLWVRRRLHSEWSGVSSFSKFMCWCPESDVKTCSVFAPLFCSSPVCRTRLIPSTRVTLCSTPFSFDMAGSDLSDFLEKFLTQRRYPFTITAEGRDRSDVKKRNLATCRLTTTQSSNRPREVLTRIRPTSSQTWHECSSSQFHWHSSQWSPRHFFPEQHEVLRKHPQRVIRQCRVSKRHDHSLSIAKLSIRLWIKSGMLHLFSKRRTLLLLAFGW